MRAINTILFHDNADFNNRFAKLELDTDIENIWNIALNGTDNNGTKVFIQFIAIDNYNNSGSVTVKIDDISSSVAPFTKVIWQVNPWASRLYIGAVEGIVTIWLSEKKLPIGEGINENGVSTVGLSVLRVNSRAAAAATVTTPDVAIYLTETGREGLFTFDSDDLSAAVTLDTAQANYIALSSDPSGASGAWVRRYNADKEPGWFGATGDGATDDLLAIQRLLDSGGGLHVPASQYYSSQRLQLRKNVNLKGDSYGFNAEIAGYANSPGTRIRFPNDVGGLIVWSQTTHDDTSDVVANPALYFTQEGANKSAIRDLGLIGSGAGAAVTGFESRIRVFLDNVQCITFKGKGFDIQGTADIDDASSNYGAVSLSALRNCKAEANGSDGFNVRGRDSSVVLVDNCDAINNGGWGFNGNSFSGDTYLNCHAAANALGAYKEASAIAGNLYAGCYVEGGTGSNLDISAPCVAIAGNLAGVLANGSTNVHSLGPPPVAISGLLSSFNQLKLTWGWDPPGTIVDICYIQRHNTHGLWLQGHGASFDFTLRNRNNADVIQNIGATQELKFSGGAIHANYTVATLPTPAAYLKGALVFATNGRNVGEGVGAGTGTSVECTGTIWKIPGTVGAVAA